MRPVFEKLFVCTHNAGKQREIQSILADLNVEIAIPDEFPEFPEPEEDGDSFLENAQIKAREAFAFTGLPSMADDSGLVVPALGGAPGVYSARYAGVVGPTKDQANRDFLREAICELGPGERAAHFHCTIVLRWGVDDDQEMSWTGRCEGVLLEEERGDGGFGYDPMFFVPSLELTFAQLDSSRKNQISHRALALAKMCEWLRNSGTP